MRKVHTLLIGTAIAALAVGVAPLTAQASESAPPAPAATGFLHVYYDTGYTNWCDDWSGEAPDWGSCRNQVSSLHNDGYPGALDDVWVYWGLNYTGARRGVANGVGLSDLRLYAFDANTGSGSGQALNDNISSHRWANIF
ncbi:hypothetical protein HY68_16120 [Streptomyces sp. AcH 505]|uniref:hypothetical protein n=1 Tax=Streptomyces sp. AcH 505 TaxID=352211 RepID=UPI000591D0B3|nr:hypothetical protein HY68_16120 [Streptomyces sp. AcH 505]